MVHGGDNYRLSLKMVGPIRNTAARLLAAMCLYTVVTRGSENIEETSTESSTTSADFNRTSYANRGISSEKKLIRDILFRYGKLGRMGRPVHNISQSVIVYFGLGLIQLDLNEKEKVLTLSMWTRYHWRDEYLTWNPDDYGGVTSIRLRPNLIWLPDIMLYNTADVDKAARDALAVITPDGGVHWYPHTIFRSSCSVDVTNFPFDSQQCHMWFGSWTHPSTEIDLQMSYPGGIDLSTFTSDYKESCGWDITNVTAQRQIMPSEEEVPNFVVLTFDIDLERKVVFSTYILTLPCVFLACLTLVVFWLPPDRPDRTALAMSTFASFMLLLLILVETAPPTASSVPTLGLYYSFNMVLIMLAIILSSLVVNISRGGAQPVPRWLFAIIHNCLARIMLLRSTKPDSTDENYYTYVGENRRYKQYYSHYQPTEAYNDRFSLFSGRRSNISKRNTSDVNSSSLSSSSTTNSRLFSSTPHLRNDGDGVTSGMGPTLKAISETLQRIEGKMEDCSLLSGDTLENIQEWKYTSLVLDRFFFLLYIVLIVVSLSILFPRPNPA